MKMMRNKFLWLVGISILLWNCKKDPDQTAATETEVDNSKLISENDIKSFDYTEFSIDNKVQAQIKDWTEYYKLQDVIEKVKASDLHFFKDNEKTIKDAFKELKATIPGTIKSPSIEARILVVETKFYKLESLFNLGTTSEKELEASVEEVLVAFSNLNLQMNKKAEFDAINIVKPQ
ncbi:hypothetical protein VQ01_01335 [Tamlana sp. s12]|nr:hypothetical protein VQ01_01335 [Tamlana sp. s12]